MHRVENHGGGDDRPGQRSTTGFVNARDMREPLRVKVQFKAIVGLWHSAIC